MFWHALASVQEIFGRAFYKRSSVSVVRRRPSDADLHEKVRQCLVHDWDPIGVRQTPEARDEYDSYVDGICSLLLSGSDAYKLRQHLAHTETVNMGLARPSPHLDMVVQKLLTLISR